MTVAYAPSFVDPDQGVLLQGPAIGSWEPTGDRSIRFTFVQALSNLDGTYRGTFTLNGFPVVSDDGLSFVDDGTQASVILRDAANAIVFQAGGGQGAAIARRRSRLPRRRGGSGDREPQSLGSWNGG
jgi:hypothetical protein